MPTSPTTTAPGKRCLMAPTPGKEAPSDQILIKDQIGHWNALTVGVLYDAEEISKEQTSLSSSCCIDIGLLCSFAYTPEHQFNEAAATTIAIQSKRGSNRNSHTNLSRILRAITMISNRAIEIGIVKQQHKYTVKSQSHGRGRRVPTLRCLAHGWLC